MFCFSTLRNFFLSPISCFPLTTVFWPRLARGPRLIIALLSLITTSCLSDRSCLPSALPPPLLKRPWQLNTQHFIKMELEKKTPKNKKKKNHTKVCRGGRCVFECEEKKSSDTVGILYLSQFMYQRSGEHWHLLFLGPSDEDSPWTNWHQQLNKQQTYRHKPNMLHWYSESKIQHLDLPAGPLMWIICVSWLPESCQDQWFFSRTMH